MKILLKYISRIEIKTIRDKRVDPTENDNECVLHAVNKNHPKTLKILLKDKRIFSGTTLDDVFINACTFGYMEVLEILLKDSRIDPRYKNFEGIM